MVDALLLIHANKGIVYRIRCDIRMQRREVVSEGFEDLGDRGRLGFEDGLLGCLGSRPIDRRMRSNRARLRFSAGVTYSRLSADQLRISPLRWSMTIPSGLGPYQAPATKKWVYGSICRLKHALSLDKYRVNEHFNLFNANFGLLRGSPSRILRNPKHIDF